MQHTPVFGPRGTQIRLSTFALRLWLAVAGACVSCHKKKTRPTMLCRACKTRLSIKQIATASFNEFVYHCPMCDTEMKQGGSHHTAEVRLRVFLG
jgi:hypothetical protein